MGRFLHLWAGALMALALEISFVPAAAAEPLALPALSLTSSVNYKDINNWMCHSSKGYPQSTCSRNMALRSVEANGDATVKYNVYNAAEIAAAPVDCFYVYPTISTDATTNSDMLNDENESQITSTQIGRYRSVCRIFAPIYRQRSLTTLAANAVVGAVVPLDLSASEQMAYGDVKDAFNNYLQYYNQGRGFILVGHSQGATILKRLIAEQIETQPALHDRLIAAYLMGSNVEVPIGADVGGTFANTPACRHADQTACVIAYSSYRDKDPELSAPRYGRASTPGNRVLCVNPAALSGGEASLDMIMPYQFPPIFQLLLKSRGTGGPYADRATNLSMMVDTPFFAVPGQVRGECVADAAGTSYLRVRIDANRADPRADDYPAEFYGGTGWGTHLADLWLTQGNLLQLAQSQSAAWLAAH